MSTLFYKDIIEKNNWTYEQLFQDIEHTEYYAPYCKTESFYDTFKQILISLFLGEHITLLDADFTDYEMESLLGSNFKVLLKPKKTPSLKNLSFEKLLAQIELNKDFWSISLFTSGTTGLPKKVSHTFTSIARNVKRDSSKQSNVWGYAYNPTHMAGLQVFFQALLNKNSIIRLFGVRREKIITLINDYKITNISATPTFYRLLLPANGSCGSVRNLTSGGEKFDSHTLKELKKMFPDAVIRNIYASTEAGSLFTSDGDLFAIKSEMIDLIKIEENELFLHSSLMGESASLKIVNEWYSTGDLVEVIEQQPLSFRFLSRKTEMINTGGYKVNPSEIEDFIRGFEGVKDVSVYGKQNSVLGTIVFCEVVRVNEQVTEKNIREFLQKKVQEFKIPRMIKFVDNLKKTKTGKTLRRTD